MMEVIQRDAIFAGNRTEVPSRIRIGVPRVPHSDFEHTFSATLFCFRTQ